MLANRYVKITKHEAKLTSLLAILANDIEYSRSLGTIIDNKLLGDPLVLLNLITIPLPLVYPTRILHSGETIYTIIANYNTKMEQDLQLSEC